ncbi:MAG: homocysteine S-methyltransferase family protein [Oscillospiraceae bacterium]
MRHCTADAGSGRSVFGGCCGTTAEHIAALRTALRDAKFVPPAPEHRPAPGRSGEASCYLPVDAGLASATTGPTRIGWRMRSTAANPWRAAAGAWEDIDALTDCSTC